MATSTTLESLPVVRTGSVLWTISTGATTREIPASVVVQLDSLPSLPDSPSSLWRHPCPGEAREGHRARKSASVIDNSLLDSMRPTFLKASTVLETSPMSTKIDTDRHLAQKQVMSVTTAPRIVSPGTASVLLLRCEKALRVWNIARRRTKEKTI